MKILAVLQNQWFKNPDRAERIYAQHIGDLDRRAKLNAAYLFMGSLTGKRLMQVFGEAGRHGIIWEEASPKKAGESSGAFPADPKHIREIITHHRPSVILAFGKIASNGVFRELNAMMRDDAMRDVVIELICGPHPAARHATVMAELRDMKAQLRCEIGGAA